MHVDWEPERRHPDHEKSGERGHDQGERVAWSPNDEGDEADCQPHERSWEPARELVKRRATSGLAFLSGNALMRVSSLRVTRSKRGLSEGYAKTKRYREGEVHTWRMRLSGVEIQMFCPAGMICPSLGASRRRPFTTMVAGDEGWDVSSPSRK